MAEVATQTIRFLEYYKDNIVKIHDYMSENSGKYQMDVKLTSDWMNSQISKRRYKAAKQLVLNMEYFEFTHFVCLLYNTLRDLYEKNEGTQFVFYVGEDQNASSWYVNALALNYIRIKEWNEPFFITEPSCDLYDLIDNESNLKFVILDECAYSGAQTCSILEGMDCDYGFKPVWEIVFPVATEVGIDRIKKEFPDSNIFSGHVITSLRSRITKLSDYLDVYRYFSPYTKASLPTGIIYFDSKIATTDSTFNFVLNFGCIPDKIDDLDDILSKVLYYLDITQEQYDNDDDVKERVDQKIENYLVDLEPNGKFTNFKCMKLIKKSDDFVDLTDLIPYNIFAMQSNKKFVNEAINFYLTVMDKEAIVCEKSDTLIDEEYDRQRNLYDSFLAAVTRKGIVVHPFYKDLN